MFKKDKTVHWTTSWLDGRKDIAGMGIKLFSVLPAIDLTWTTDKWNEGEYEFHIDFEWLWWSFRLSRYWGEIYKKHNFD